MLPNRCLYGAANDFSSNARSYMAVYHLCNENFVVLTTDPRKTKRDILPEGLRTANSMQFCRCCGNFLQAAAFLCANTKSPGPTMESWGSAALVNRATEMMICKYWMEIVR